MGPSGHPPQEPSPLPAGAEGSEARPSYAAATAPPDSTGQHDGVLGAQTCPPPPPAPALQGTPHHVELVQAQPVYARPLAIHGLPEGLKEQELWKGKGPEENRRRTRKPLWDVRRENMKKRSQDVTCHQTLGSSVRVCGAVKQCHQSGFLMGL